MTGAPSPGGSLQVADEVAETTASHAAAEGAEPTGDVGSKSTLREMLFSTGPEKPLEQVESPWDPERGGRTRVYRGIQKMIDSSGMPAIGDVVIGGLEEIKQFDLEGNDAGNEQEGEDVDGGLVDAAEQDDQGGEPSGDPLADRAARGP
jgi:hypothetical protein